MVDGLVVPARIRITGNLVVRQLDDGRKVEGWKEREKIIFKVVGDVLVTSSVHAMGIGVGIKMPLVAG